MKGISPVPDGYLVRIYRNGRAISQHVSISHYANASAAQAAAQRVLKQLEKAYPKTPRPGRKPSVGYTFTRGNSGAGRRMFCWQVVYYVDGVRKTKRFYPHKYSDPGKAERYAKKFAEEHE